MLYTLDVSQYAIGAGESENFYHCINKALQTREPLLMRQLAGQVAVCESMCSTPGMDSQESSSYEGKWRAHSGPEARCDARAAAAHAFYPSPVSR